MNITQYLKSFSDETLYYCPNPGNAGDSLIAHATFQLFKKHNVNYKLFNFFDSREFEPMDKVLVYGGGGNLVNNYCGSARKFLEKYHRLAKKIIILPHTINTHKDLLKELGNNVDIICREEISYNYVEKLTAKANVMLMDDMAFSLDVKNTLAQEPISFSKSLGIKIISKVMKNNNLRWESPSPKLMLGNNIMEMQKFWERISKNDKKKIFNCFRTDKERSNINIPKDNIDLSKKFQYGTSNEKMAFYASYRLLNMINQYDEISTNRLHVAIAGALLGKSVKFYSNSYYKCKAVYEYSIKDKFSNVQWIG